MSLLVAITGETDPNEVRKRVEECVELHSIRNSQHELVAAAHKRHSEQLRENDADRVTLGKPSPETALKAILAKCQ
jgi:hypothetical protein